MWSTITRLHCRQSRMEHVSNSIQKLWYKHTSLRLYLHGILCIIDSTLLFLPHNPPQSFFSLSRNPPQIYLFLPCRHKTNIFILNVFIIHLKFLISKNYFLIIDGVLSLYLGNEYSFRPSAFNLSCSWSSSYQRIELERTRTSF